MPASNRATLIGKLATALKKYYKPAPAGASRPLLEHLLYASLLEDAPADLADEGMAKCEQEFYDWNEVRVTTVTELSQVLSRLPDPMKAAQRLKANLQGVFEEFYTFDIDHLKKENLGKAINKFEKMQGMSPFVLSYTIQHGMGGHSIPIDYSAMVIMLATEIATQPEAMAGKVPGLERAIPKNKGIEFSSLLHQAGVALSKSTKDKTAREFLESVSKGSGKRLEEWLASKKAAKKRAVTRKVAEKEAAVQAKKDAAEAAKFAAKAPSKKKKSTKAVPPQPVVTEPKAMPTKEVAKKSPTKKPDSKKSTAVSQKKPAKKAAPKGKPVSKKKTTVKKVTKKSATKKPVNKKSSKKSVNRKLTKRKPR